VSGREGGREWSPDATLARPEPANVIPRTSQVVRCNLAAGNRIEGRRQGGRPDGGLKVRTRRATRGPERKEESRESPRRQLKLVAWIEFHGESRRGKIRAATRIHSVIRASARASEQ